MSKRKKRETQKMVMTKRNYQIKKEVRQNDDLEKKEKEIDKFKTV